MKNRSCGGNKAKEEGSCKIFSALPRNQVHFSSAAKSDNFTGGSLSDFIYGGAVIVYPDNYAATAARRCAA